MSFQEERPWTDYVRIATPIVGLLVLLAVFWFWASSLIGDTNNTQPTATTAAAVLTVIAQPTSTPTATQEVDIPAQTPEPTTEPTEEGAPPENTPEGGESATNTPEESGNDTGGDTPTSGAAFEEGESIVVSVDDSVNMRAEPTKGADSIEQLVDGDQLVVLSAESVEADGYTWWNVRNEATGSEGWVADEFLKPIE